MACFCINVQTLGHGNCCHNRCHLPWRNTPHWKVISPLIPSCFCHGKGLAWDRMKPPEKWLTISNNFCSVIGAIIIATCCYVVAWLQYREEEESKVCEVVMLVEVLRPDDPRSCQMDARFQPRQSSGSVVPAKDVRTRCPDTPSDGFVSHGQRD